MKTILSTTILLVIVGLCNSIAQDIIIFRTGEEVEVKVSKVSPSEVEYHKWSNLDGPIYTSLKSEIFMIKYQNGTKDVFPIAESLSYTGNGKEEIVNPKIFKNAFFGELGGLGYILSLNYERMFHHKENSFFSIRTGIAPLGRTGVFNAGISFNSGKNGNYAEVGLGGGYFFRANDYYEDRPGYVYFSPMFGYRRLSQTGFLFKAYMSMLTIREIYEDYHSVNNASINTTVNNGSKTQYYFVPFAGVCFGYSF